MPARSVLNVATSVAAGTAFDVGGYREVSVYITATAMTATIAIQSSPDGTNWITEATVTAPAKVVIDGPTCFVRANTTAYTSSADLAGHVVGSTR